MDFDQIVAKYPGGRYQAHLGLLFLFYIQTGQVIPVERKLFLFVNAKFSSEMLNGIKLHYSVF